MNIWLITDIARKFDMEVFWFEPNPLAQKLLNKKYKDDNKVHIYPHAVSDNNWEMELYLNPKALFDQWASIIEECEEFRGGEKNSLKVKVKRLTDVLKNEILIKHKHIHILKMDIEWSEFSVLNDIINEWLYKDFDKKYESYQK